MTVDLAALAKLASEATPGPWKSILPGDLSWKDRRSYRCVAFSRRRDERYTTSPLLPLDAAFIAAASPDVVAALVRVALAAKAWGKSKQWLDDSTGIVEWTAAEKDEEATARQLRAALADLDR
jgi:hypothetical protein